MSPCQDDCRTSASPIQLTPISPTLSMNYGDDFYHAPLSPLQSSSRIDYESNYERRNTRDGNRYHGNQRHLSRRRGARPNIDVLYTTGYKFKHPESNYNIPSRNSSFEGTCTICGRRSM